LRFKRAQLGAVDPAGWIEIVHGFTTGDPVVIAPGKLADLNNEGRRVVTATHGPEVIVAEK
jgi:hypothetical protein